MSRPGDYPLPYRFAESKEQVEDQLLSDLIFNTVPRVYELDSWKIFNLMTFLLMSSEKMTSGVYVDTHTDGLFVDSAYRDSFPTKIVSNFLFYKTIYMIQAQQHNTNSLHFKIKHRGTTLYGLQLNTSKNNTELFSRSLSPLIISTLTLCSITTVTNPINTDILSSDLYFIRKHGYTIIENIKLLKHHVPYLDVHLDILKYELESVRIKLKTVQNLICFSKYYMECVIDHMFNTQMIEEIRCGSFSNEEIMRTCNPQYPIL